MSVKTSIQIPDTVGAELSAEDIVLVYQELTGDLLRESLRSGTEWNRAFNWLENIYAPKKLQGAFENLKDSEKAKVLKALGYGPKSEEAFCRTLERLHNIEHVSKGLEWLNQGTSGDTRSDFINAAYAFENLTTGLETFDPNGSIYKRRPLWKIFAANTPADAWEEGKDYYHTQVLEVLSEVLRHRLKLVSAEGAREAIRDSLIPLGALISLETVDGEEGPRIKNLHPQLILKLRDQKAGLSEKANDPPAIAESNLARIFGFVEEFFTDDDAGNLYIQADAGRLYSAVTLAILAKIYGPGNEERAVEDLYRVNRRAAPEQTTLELADSMLNRGGKLSKAVRANHKISGNYRTVRRNDRKRKAVLENASPA